jgi:hypothetical protein
MQISNKGVKIVGLELSIFKFSEEVKLTNVACKLSDFQNHVRISFLIHLVFLARLYRTGSRRKNESGSLRNDS